MKAARTCELHESQGGVGDVRLTKVAHCVAARPNYLAARFERLSGLADGPMSLVFSCSYVPALDGDASLVGAPTCRGRVCQASPGRQRRGALSLRRVHVSAAGLTRWQASIQRGLVVATVVMNGQC